MLFLDDGKKNIYPDRLMEYIRPVFFFIQSNIWNVAWRHESVRFSLTYDVASELTQQKYMERVVYVSMFFFRDLAVGSIVEVACIDDEINESSALWVGLLTELKKNVISLSVGLFKNIGDVFFRLGSKQNMTMW